MTPQEWADHWTAQADLCWCMVSAATVDGDDDKVAEFTRLALRAERAAYRWSTSMAGR